MRNYIDKILEKFGYVRINPVRADKASEGEIQEMFSAYGDNDMFKRFLHDLTERDIKLYFQASNDNDRAMIRGAHARTSYFRNLIKKANERKTKEPRVRNSRGERSS